ncbi:unnamed protein product [Pleuronectes platessa]|uniref:SAM domain-containing protein n=1 Tax=Pleuronectes platessa TaxID=8262 RepID=A0A9N7VC01_PLEPL|nr:unnamed protein product [Pleuronectes platessa]
MKHQSISRWLSQLGLPQYCTGLEQEYDGVEDLLHLSEYDLLELGIHNHLHRLHLLTSLRLLQERERRRESRQRLIAPVSCKDMLMPGGSAGGGGGGGGGWGWGWLSAGGQ